ncbi:hypothetical protein CR513_49705, partial [Mucuna pruriens]
SSKVCCDNIGCTKRDLQNYSRSLKYLIKYSCTYIHVVSFDTIYNTNKHCMIFAPFTDINHHQ